MSTARLIVRENGKQLRSRQTEQRQALDRMHEHVRPERVEEPRDDVDLDVAARLSARTRSIVSSVGALRERDDDPLDADALDELRQVRGRADHARCECRARSSSGVVVDEADEVDAVLGMLLELARHELADRRRRRRSACAGCTRAGGGSSACECPRPPVMKDERERPEAFRPSASSGIGEPGDPARRGTRATTRA